MNMIKKTVAVGLLAVASAAMVLPALAEVDVTFRKYDYDHDGRWSYGEFRDANRVYYHRHPDAMILDDGALRHEFRRLDRDHDGYVRVDEIRHYRTWD